MHTQLENENHHNCRKSVEKNVIENTMENAERYVLYLIKCALHGCAPTQKLEKCSWNQILYLSENNNVISTISPAVKEYPYEMPADVWEKIEDALQKTLYRNLRFQIERENIFKAMEQRKIDHLPLKGILLSEYYPKAGMRWMCDNDILYRISNLDAKHQVRKMTELMAEQGYEAVHTGGVHDVYQKKPFFNFEMHRKLASADSLYAEYYATPWKKAVLTEGKKYEYYFRDEDEYIFMLVHAHKHFDDCGCGIRTLVDEYVFVNKKNSMDWKYIEEELEKLGIASFEKELKKTAFDAFSEEEILTEQDWNMIQYMFKSGTYGTVDNHIRRKLERVRDEGNLNPSGTWWRYWKQRLFLSDSVMEESYPFFYRHKKLRWLLPVYRIIRGLVRNPKRLYYEWKYVGKYR